MDALDARQYRRIPANCPIVFSAQDTVQDGTLLNLSYPGCAVKSTAALPIGTALELCVLMPDRDFPLALDGAVVRWSTSDTLGLEFVSMREVERERLGGYLERDAIGSSVTDPE